VTAGTPTDATGKFVALVLGDTEDRWTEIFAANGKNLSPAEAAPVLGFRTDAPAPSPSRPWGRSICPRDQRVYLDNLAFSSGPAEQVRRLLGQARPGKFSEAYVIATRSAITADELGILPRVTQAQQPRSSPDRGEPLQVRIELQADCFGRRMGEPRAAKTQFLDPGDVRSGLANRDRHRRRSCCRKECRASGPNSFTHVRHASAGLERLQVGSGLGRDTLSASTLLRAAACGSAESRA